MIGWNCVWKLLQGPFRRWVRGEIAVEDAPGPKFHEEKDVESSESSSNHNEKIAGDDGLSVVADKRLPVLRGGSVWSSRAGFGRPIRPHRSWRT